ncbi:MAG: hypothetical protein ACQEQ0_06750 [Bacteroidota bacterium]
MTQLFWGHKDKHFQGKTPQKNGLFFQKFTLVPANIPKNQEARESTLCPIILIG